MERFKQAVLGIPFFNKNPFNQFPEELNSKNRKEDLLQKLPKVLNSEIGYGLTINELISLVQSSKSHAKLFNPVLNVRKFLHHVTRGEYDAVEAMLRKDSTLLTQRGKITDCSGRFFSNISGFEYALWALDKHMWTRMLNCIPKDAQGKQIHATLLEQYKNVKEKGVTYRPKDKPITELPTSENHFDFANTLIKELQTQDKLSNGPDPDWNAVMKQWIEGVGGAQKLLPMHVVYEYCGVMPFQPIPDFTTQPILRKQIRREMHGPGAFENDSENYFYENWFRSNSSLGIYFGVYRGRNSEATAWDCDFGRGPEDVVPDLAAMTALCNIRTNDFINLGPQLEANLDNTPSAAP